MQEFCLPSSESGQGEQERCALPVEVAPVQHTRPSRAREAAMLQQLVWVCNELCPSCDDRRHHGSLRDEVWHGRAAKLLWGDPQRLDHNGGCGRRNAPLEHLEAHCRNRQVATVVLHHPKPQQSLTCLVQSQGGRGTRQLCLLDAEGDHAQHKLVQTCRQDARSNVGGQRLEGSLGVHAHHDALVRAAHSTSSLDRRSLTDRLRASYVQAGERVNGDCFRQARVDDCHGVREGEGLLKSRGRDDDAADVLLSSTLPHQLVQDVPACSSCDI